MTAPLWLDAPSAQARPPLEGDLRVDVCIVGAGSGGLSAAWHLAERGITVTLVDARTAGSGASGRNGGFLTVGTALPYHEARRVFGLDLARRMYASTVDAQERVLAIAEEIGAADVLRRVGVMRVCTDPGESEDAQLQLAALLRDGFVAEPVDEAGLPEALRRAGRSAIFKPHDVLMQPARWYRALAAALESRGVRIAEGTPVEAPIYERDGGAWVLRTPGGRIVAERVVVACDAGLPTLVPHYVGRVRSVRLHMLASAPAGRTVLPVGCGWRWGYEYAQQLPDGRVALGGFRDLEGAEADTDAEQANPAVHERLERELREQLGVEAPVTHRWVGMVGYSIDDRPFVGAVPDCDGLYVAGGYCGAGNLNGFVAGRVLAELVAGGGSADADLYDASR